MGSNKKMHDNIDEAHEELSNARSMSTLAFAYGKKRNQPASITSSSFGSLMASTIICSTSQGLVNKRSSILVVQLCGAEDRGCKASERLDSVFPPFDPEDIP